MTHPLVAVEGAGGASAVKLMQLVMNALTSLYMGLSLVALQSHISTITCSVAMFPHQKKVFFLSWLVHMLSTFITDIPVDQSPPYYPCCRYWAK